MKAKQKLSARLLAAAAALLWLVMAIGCAARSPALFYSGEATQMFDTYQVNDDYNYYYSGSEVYPRAVIGIDKAYTLVTDLWKPIHLTPGKLKDWREWSHKELGLASYSLPGAFILAPDGKRIGVWFDYQYRRAFSRVIVNADRTVMVSVPADPNKPIFFPLFPSDAWGDRDGHDRP
jgi:hypothetical protein